MTDGHFDPKHDFLDIENTRSEVPGIEVPTTEPVIVTFYVSKWTKTGMPETNIDFNLQWVGLLSTDVSPQWSVKERTLVTTLLTSSQNSSRASFLSTTIAAL